MEWYTLSAGVHELVLAPSQAVSEDPYQIECSLNHHGKLGAILDEGELIHSLFIIIIIIMKLIF